MSRISTVQIVLQRHHATVSVVHAFTENPEHLTREADILITAAGVPNLIRGNWLKPGAVVIDVGTNPIEVISRCPPSNFLQVLSIVTWICTCIQEIIS